MQPNPGSHTTFVLPANFPHVPLSVVGDFNQWDSTAHPFTQTSDGTYQVTMTLETGAATPSAISRMAESGSQKGWLMTCN